MEIQDFSHGFDTLLNSYAVAAGFGSTDKVDNENTSAPTGSAESQNIVEETAEQTATEVAAGDVDAPEQAE